MRLRLLALTLLAVAVLPLPAQALDLNSYRAAHGRAPLQRDSFMTGLAYYHAGDLARREALDHANFARERGPLGAVAENVSHGCSDESCAILQWARSGAHRANMLRRDVSTYGLASVTSASGRRYWVMELGGRIATPVPGGKGAAPRFMESAAPRRR